MGQLIDTASAWTQDQMGRDSWSTMCQFGLRIESAGIAGGPLSSQSRLQIGQDSWPTRGTLDPGPSWAG